MSVLQFDTKLMLVRLFIQANTLIELQRSSKKISLKKRFVFDVFANNSSINTTYSEWPKPIFLSFERESIAIVFIIFIMRMALALK